MAVASIHPLASEDPVRAESFAWARFSAARDKAEFCSGWLAILCTQIDRVNGALLLLGTDESGAFAPAAIWPDPSHDLRHLSPTAQRVLAERKGILVEADGQSPPTRDHPAHIGYPIEVSGVLQGAVVVEVAPSSEAALQRHLRLGHWGSAWLIHKVPERSVAETDGRVARISLSR